MTCRCEEESQSDYVSVTSDYVTDDHVTSGRRMCGRNAQNTDVEQFRSDHFDQYTDLEQFRSDQYTDVEQFRSNSSSLYVEFRSFDATGLEATCQFYSPVQGTTIRYKIFNMEYS